MFIQHVKQPLGQITLKSGCRPWRLREPPKGVELNMEIARHATICIFPNAQFIKIKTHYIISKRQTEGSLSSANTAV